MADKNDIKKIKKDIDDLTGSVKKLNKELDKSNKALKDEASDIAKSMKEQSKSAKDYSKAISSALNVNTREIEKYAKVYLATRDLIQKKEKTDELKRKRLERAESLASKLNNKQKGSKLQNAGSSASSGELAALSSKAAIIGAGLAITVKAAMDFYDFSKKMQERNADLSRSLVGATGAYTAYTSSIIENENKLVDIKNSFNRLGEAVSKTSLVRGLFDTVLSGIDGLVSGLARFAELFDSTDVRSGVESLDSLLAADTGYSKSSIAGTVNSIASSTKQSGFTTASSVNLGSGTFKQAMLLSEKYGQDAVDIAEKLASAWLDGSDAAKEYGVVVDDLTLAGYAASKGIDIVNVTVSEARKQQLRYEMMLEQSGATNEKSMQDQIQQWKKLGMMIDATKNKLFSFDEVIQLTAMDTTIPEVGDQTVENIKSDSEKENKHIAPFLLPFGPFSPLISPILDPDAMGGVLSALDSIPQNITVGVAVSAPGSGLISTLEEGLSRIGTLWPVEIALTATPVGLLGSLTDQLLEISKTWMVNVDISALGAEALLKVNNLLNSVLNTASRVMSALGIKRETAEENGAASNSLMDPALESRMIQREKQFEALQKKKGFYDKLGSISQAGLDFYEKHNLLGVAGLLATTGAGLVGLGGLSLSATPGAANFGAAKGLAAANTIQSAGAGASVLNFADFATKSVGKIAAADGGIGTHEVHNATLFEGDKAEAIIPLETSAGIKYLSDALQAAGLNNTSYGGNITVNLTLSGVNIADNEAQWQRVGKKIAEVIDVQRQRRGELSYGSIV